MATYPNARRAFLGRLAQTSRSVRTFFDAELRQVDLTLARGRLLLHLTSSSKPVSQGELSELLEVEHPTTVRLLDGLEQLGHIERRPMPGDRRAKEVALTAEGRRIGEQVLAMTDGLSSDLLSNIDPGDLVVAERVLEQISENVTRQIAAASEEPMAS